MFYYDKKAVRKLRLNLIDECGLSSFFHLQKESKKNSVITDEILQPKNRFRKQFSSPISKKSPDFK